MDTLRRLFFYTWRYRKLAFLAYGALAGSALLSLVIPRLFGNVVNVVVEALEKDFYIFAGSVIEAVDGTSVLEQIQPLLFFAGLILAATLVKGVFTFSQVFVGEYLSQRVCFDLRNRIFNQYQRLSFAYHDRSQTGQLMSRATSDVEQIRFFVSQGLINGALMLLTFVAVLVVLLLINWKLALLSLATMPVLFVIAVLFARQLRPMFSQVQQETAQLSTVLQEDLSGMRVVRAFAQEEQETAKFLYSSDRLAVATSKTMELFAMRNPLLQFIAGIGTTAVIWYGGLQVIDSTISLGTMVEFSAYLMMLQRPIRMLGMTINTYARAVAAGERIFEILDTQSEIEEKPDAIDMASVAGNVKFESVSYKASGLPVLQDITIEARAGEVIGIVGSTGSGKSTIINLLPRFYDVTGGRITLDGYDIRDLTFRALRQHIGLVAQETFLFAASIRENISYGRPDATEEGIIAAAKAAQAHDFIMQIPDGYDTHVGERGVTLSGGQKQRIAIARALLLDPRVLVLDESTSAVDTRTEAALQVALKELMRGRTTFIVAQRISSVREANEIIVLDEGRIVQRGTHAALVTQEGLYRDMYVYQLQEQEEHMERQRAAQTDGLSLDGAVVVAESAETPRGRPV
jgi:ATP-binding cassette subfamily B multidrug efflux pump